MHSGSVDTQLSSAFSLHKRWPSSPTSTTTLNDNHISEALLKSEDNGATLDFSHRGITDVDEFSAAQLAAVGREDPMEDESSLLRVTLASNRLATLPATFALLSHLRYLNLKNNCLAVFPDVLTAMPSLEILDIGRNKVKKLPSQPGSLLNLRVFSFYKNKITRLPPYLVKFTRLSILRAEQNPWEWPPKSVMEMQSKDFVKTVQQWIEGNPPSENYEESERESQRTNFEISEGQENVYLNGSTPHARSFSQSSTPPTHLENSVTQLSDPSPSHSGQPSPFPLDHFSFSGQTSPPSRSPDAYFPTHEDFLDLSADDDISKPTDTLAHIRNASYAGSSRVSGRPNLFLKKSLPDLRHAKVPLTEERPIRSPSAPLWNCPVDQPPSFRQDSSNSSDSGPTNSRPDQAFLHGEIASSPITPNRPAPTMDGERHSYFRRFSVLQSSSISKTIPDSLLRLVDAARGILFAVSQIYQALRHYTVDAIDERLASVLLKVLDPASHYITQLINALDRFDSMSRRTLPTPLVCRGVLESCKDNVAIFGKAVGVLALQLKVLATQDDVRYTRQMLLVLYGAAAEISNAWRSMVPHLESAEPLLRDHRPPPATKTRPGGPSLVLPVSPNPMTSPTPPLVSFPARPTLVPLDSSAPAERTHIARRHAGSFSSRDVETGRIMASSDEPTIMQKRVAVGTAAETPTPRVTRRQPGLLPLYSASLVTTARKGSQQSHDAHSRQGSLSSLVESSSSSSPSITGRLTVEIPSTLDSLVDKEAIDAMSKAVEAAPPVWTMMDSITADISETREEIKEMLVKAQRVTQQLKSDISLLRDGLYVDRKTLRNDAHLFVKLVVHLSTDVKTHVDSHPLSAALRANMVQLTNATEEFVILLHVSSFSNASTPRPYTPLVNGLSSNSAIIGATSEDSHLGASLSRSRSALTTTSRTMITPKDMPLTALPQQSFRIPPIPHRLKRTPTEDSLDVI
ncbi:RAM signaling pathway protein-domain-containing protein [Lactarius quietus]|nr:RAM signaling pathway protein-domain-containing protein [Lactarius quietus]